MMMMMMMMRRRSRQQPGKQCHGACSSLSSPSRAGTGGTRSNRIKQDDHHHNHHEHDNDHRDQDNNDDDDDGTCKTAGLCFLALRRISSTWRLKMQILIEIKC